jgi:hypothetical protein
MVAFSAVTRACGLPEAETAVADETFGKTRGDAGEKASLVVVVAVGTADADLPDGLEAPDLAFVAVGFFFAASALLSGVSAAAAASSGFAGRT